MVFLKCTKSSTVKKKGRNDLTSRLLLILTEFVRFYLTFLKYIEEGSFLNGVENRN